MLWSKLPSGWRCVASDIELQDRQAHCSSVQAMERGLIWWSRNMAELVLNYWVGWRCLLTEGVYALEGRRNLWPCLESKDDFSIVHTTTMSIFAFSGYILVQSYSHHGTLPHKYGFATKSSISGADLLLTLLLSIILTSNCKCFDICSN